ncbi:MAG TPA: four helix bundle protein [Patescibacteria group bacterium]|nr:four helix bundle protein [Patescibacteria group bacterium]
MIKSFKDLRAYSEAYDLALLVGKSVNKLPTFERNDLGSQLRRASKSVPANIAEGWAKRRFEKEFKKYLDSAIGSCNEMEVHLLLSRDLEYLKRDFCDNLIQSYVYLGGMLVKLRNNWKSK